MVDTRITNILTPKVTDTSAPMTRGETALKIISTTGDLQNVRTSVQVQGTVTSVSKDNSTATIQTTKGDVTVQLRNNNPLQQGQSVEIDVPPGQPPRQAIVRPDAEVQENIPPPAGSTSSQQPSTAQPPATQPNTSLDPVSSQPQPQNAASTSAQTLPPDVRSTLDQAAPPIVTASSAPLPAPLPGDAIVRLLPLAGFPPQSELLPLPASIPGPLQVLIEQAKQLLLQPVGIQPGDEGSPFIKTQSSPGTPISGKLPELSELKNFLNEGLNPKIPGSFDARILAIRPQGIGNFRPVIPAPGTGAFPEPINADVVAITKNGFPVVSLTLQDAKIPRPFLIQFPATNIPAGTQLEIQPQQQILPVPGETEPAITPGGNPVELLTGWTWPVFDDTLQTLSQMMPQAQMAQTMTHMLPNPSTSAQTISNTMMFFIAAVQSGDIVSWMGDKAISALRRDQGRGGDVLSRLTRDIETLGRTMDTGVTQDWKGLALPLYWQSEIQKIHLFYRHQGGEDDKEEKTGTGKSTRFIFDINLTKMGDIQIDGLMKANRLDVILRTGTMLSAGMQLALRQKYLSVLENGSLTGDLAFQNRMDQWVKVKIDAKPAGWASSA